MSVIVTVHGTFAAGPEHGDKWWQKDSAFQRQINEWVSATGGELRYMPFQWDGKNSEISRRAAGKALAKKLSEVTEPTVLVGHSHGGSVIQHALAAAKQNNINLDHIQRIITVGTPFLTFAPSRFLFATLGPWGKSLSLATMLVFLILLAGATSRSFYPETVLNTQKYLDLQAKAITYDPSTGVVGAVSAIVLLVILYWIYKRFRRRRLNRTVQLLKESQVAFASRTTCFQHPADEAILGLRAGTQRPLEIFQAKFFEPLLSGALIVLPVLALTFIGLFDSSTDYLYELFKSFFSMFGVDYEPLKNTHERNVFSNLDRLGYALGRPWAILFGFTSPDPITSAIITPIMALLVAVYVFVISAAIVGVLSLCSRPLSKLLARVSNKLTTQQILDTSWGNDAIGEKCIEAGTSPLAANCVDCALPDELGKDLQERSDSALQRSIPKLREALNKFSASAHTQDDSYEFWDALDGDELIHNQYFRTPRFNMLVAQTIANTDGFSATDALRTTKDYETVARWYADLASHQNERDQQKVDAQSDTLAKPRSWILRLALWLFWAILLVGVSIAASTLWVMSKYGIGMEYLDIYSKEIASNTLIFFSTAAVVTFLISWWRRRRKTSAAA